jgi:predicted nucleic acid-binding protein
VIYVDTSALLNLVHPESESVPLRTWLAGHPDDLVSSALVRTETRRALLRNDRGALPNLPAVSSVIAQIPVTEVILDSAAMYPVPCCAHWTPFTSPALRQSLALTALLAYDKPLVEASRLAGFTVVSPARRPDRARGRAACAAPATSRPGHTSGGTALPPASGPAHIGWNRASTSLWPGTHRVEPRFHSDFS